MPNIKAIAEEAKEIMKQGAVIITAAEYRKNSGSRLQLYFWDEREAVMDIISKDDLLDYKEILNEWMTDPNIEVNLTIDREQEGWDGHVGFVPNFVKELNPDVGMTVVLCGPPVMIKFTLAGLKELGFQETQVYTTMELRMKCGVGKCGRCNIGNKYVCKDGPVFRFDQLDELPNEY